MVKFDPRSSKIVYATRIGGSGWDAAFRVVVDVRGRVWVSGTTQSADFPFKNAERRHSDQGAINAFVARLDRDGAVEDMALVGDATGEGLVVTPDGTAYLTGTKAPSEEKHYAYVAEIRERGSPRLLTIGPGTASGVAVDKRGFLFAAGFDGRGAFVARVQLSAWTMVTLRSIGSADGDRARDVAIDGSGRPHVLGTAVSPDFCPKRSLAGKSDIFVAGFDADLSRSTYCVSFGGSADDLAGFNGGSLKIDSQNKLWLSGSTRSPDLKAQGRFAGLDDALVVSCTPGCRQFRLASYFGGEGFELFEGLALAPDGSVWTIGLTSSKSLTASGHHGGRSDAILVKWTNESK